MTHSVLQYPLQLKKGTYSLQEGIQMPFDGDLEAFIASYLQGPALVAAWEVHRFIWGRFDGNQLSLSDGSQLNLSQLTEIRVFNDAEELYLRNDFHQLQGRYIIDEGDTSSEYVDSIGRLWGEKVDRNGFYITLQDKERKMAMTIPCQEDATYYGLCTRNYVGYTDSSYQATYVDYRYVAIQAVEGGGHHGK